MKLIITGSGGCVSLPKPLCQCKVCKEARVKGKPYSRFGCSLYVEDNKLLIDTPEDIVHALNYADIQEVKHVMFSHVDPDHTLGIRVFEQLRINWLEVSEGRECTDPVRVYAAKNVMDDINGIRFKYGSYLDYYEGVRHLIKRESVDRDTTIDGMKISLVPAGSATVFVLEQNGRKAIYAPCDVKPFPDDAIFDNADILIIGNTVIGDTLKDGFVLSEDNWLRRDLFQMDEIVKIKDKYHISKVIMTHIEEDWGKSYDDYLDMEKCYEGISFAFDGMVVEI